MICAEKIAREHALHCADPCERAADRNHEIVACHLALCFDSVATQQNRYHQACAVRRGHKKRPHGQISKAPALAATLCSAGSHCPDPKLQEAAIGGNTIDGRVLLHKKPLKFAKVRLRSSSGETAWIGKTDKDGTFKTAQLPPGERTGFFCVALRFEPQIEPTRQKRAKLMFFRR